MVFANEFERLKQRMEESRGAKDEPAKEVSEGSDADDEQMFNSSIRQLWQQAVDVHQRNTQKEELKKATSPTEENASKENQTDGVLADSAEIDTGEQPEDTTELPTELGDMPVFPYLSATAEDVPVEEAEIAEMSTAAEVLEIPEPICGQAELSPFKQIETTLDFSGILPDEESVEGADVESSIESLAEISLEQLHREINELVESVYSHYQTQLQELFGVQVAEMDTANIQATKLSGQLSAIASVATGQGRITEQAVQAVNELIPVLWKSIKDDAFRVPEEWYGTNLGYLCRYIKLGTANQKFDPIDLPTAATMLHMTEKELIEIYPKLGGVKLSSGYVFSRQKVEEFKGERNETFTPVTIEMLQGYYRNTKECLTNLMRVHQVMNESYDEIRYIRDLLLSGIDFSHNRIKPPVKILIEQRLAALYQKYQGIHDFNFEKIEVGESEWASYTAPNIFVVLEQCGSNTLNGDVLSGMLEEMIRYIDDERTKMNELTIVLTKNLGQLNIDIEMLKIKQAL